MGVMDMEDDKVAEMVVDMEVDMVVDMEVDKVADHLTYLAYLFGRCFNADEFIFNIDCILSLTSVVSFLPCWSPWPPSSVNS